MEEEHTVSLFSYLATAVTTAAAPLNKLLATATAAWFGYLYYRYQLRARRTCHARSISVVQSDPPLYVHVSKDGRRWALLRRVPTATQPCSACASRYPREYELLYRCRRACLTFADIGTISIDTETLNKLLLVPQNAVYRWEDALTAMQLPVSSDQDSLQLTMYTGETIEAPVIASLAESVGNRTPHPTDCAHTAPSTQPLPTTSPSAETTTTHTAHSPLHVSAKTPTEHPSTARKYRCSSYLDK